MKDISTLIKLTIPSFSDSKCHDNVMRTEELLQQKIDRFNNSFGVLNKTDGIDCDVCKNKGYTFSINDSGDDFLISICSCQRRREAVQMMAQRLGENLNKKLSDYRVDYQWQKQHQLKMINYLKNHSKDNVWFAAFGTFGCGKTLICCIISNYLLYKEKRVVAYVEWTELMNDINSLETIKDYNTIHEKMDYLKNVDVLYLDDLIKDFNPKTRDKNYFFEIINHRYLNDLKTIISSQYTVKELLDIDEAIFSRVIQKCSKNIINEPHDRNKNLRLLSILGEERK